MSNNPHEVAKREAWPLPNVKKYIPTGGEHGSRSFPEQPEAHRVYVARPRGAPNSHSMPLGPRPVALSPNALNKAPLANRHVQRAK